MAKNTTIPKEWEELVSTPDLQEALLAHFSYLADSPGYTTILKDIVTKAHKVSINTEWHCLEVDFPGGEKLSAYLPASKISKKFPPSYQKVLRVHETLYLKNPMLTLGDHGMFNESDGWFEALEEEDSELLEHGSLSKIISPMMDYSDMWLYHPKERTPQGEPVLYYLSHEGGDIFDAQDCSIGSLFLQRMAKNLGLEVEAPVQVKTLDPIAWYKSLDEHWRAAFKHSMEIENADQAKQVFRESEIYLNAEFAVETLEPLRPLLKLTHLRVNSPVLKDISALEALPKLTDLCLSSLEPINLEVLAACPKLERLDLSESSVTQLDFVRHLPKLERLEVSATKVSDLSPLVLCKKLDTLEIQGTDVTDLSPLSKLKNLRSLDIASTKITDLSPLSGIKSLSRVKLDETGISSLTPLYACKQIHILHLDDTAINFEEILRYRAHHSKIKHDWDLGLDIYHSLVMGSPSIFLEALKNIDFPLTGLEAALAEWVNIKLITCLKSTELETQALATPILEAFLALPWKTLDRTIQEDLAGNALVPIVNGQISPETEALVFSRLIPKEIDSYVLLFNLACYFAKKGDKASLLEYATRSIKKGQDRTRFEEDSDFAAYQNDPEFRAVFETNHHPHPETDTKGWWNEMPKSWKACFSDLEFTTVDELREQLHKEDFRLYCSDPRTLDPLQGLTGLHYLTIVDIKTKSLKSLEGLTGLREFECEYDRYGATYPITSIAPLSTSVNLEVLKLPGHPLESLEPISHFGRLRHIHIKCVNRINSALFAKMADLESVLLSGKIDNLLGFKGKGKLHYLNLDGSVDNQPLDLSPLAKLPNLKFLYLHDVPILSILPLLEVASLETLIVSEHSVSATDAAAFKKALPGCDLNVR